MRGGGGGGGGGGVGVANSADPDQTMPDSVASYQIYITT